MKKIKKIICDGFKMDYHKVKKDFIVYLTTKSYPSKKSVDKMPKIGMKFALSIGNNQVEFWERIAKDKSGNCWKLLGTFTFTEVEICGSRVSVRKQNYIHKDILNDKKECELFFDDGSRQIVNGTVLSNYLFDGCNLPENEPRKNVITNLLEIADEFLNGEQLVEKMRLEINMGICPF